MRGALLALMIAAACGGSKTTDDLSLAQECAPIDPCPGATSVDGSSVCSRIDGAVCAEVTITVRCHCRAGVVEMPFPSTAATCESLLSAWNTSVCGH